MFHKNENRVLIILDVMEIVLSVIAIIIFTLIFRLETRHIRYLFLLGDCYVIYSFAKTVSTLETKIEEKLAKNVEKKVSVKSVKELSA